MARLTLTFLDSFHASIDVEPLSLRSARILALLAYLALEPAREHTREVLAALFWPDEPDQVARQNLRQALYQLRQLLGEQAAPPLLVTRDTVQFNFEHLKQGAATRGGRAVSGRAAHAADQRQRPSGRVAGAAARAAAHSGAGRAAPAGRAGA